MQQRWEYKVYSTVATEQLDGKLTAKELEELMNLFGDSGWELIGPVNEHVAGVGTTWLFKRAVMAEVRYVGPGQHRPGIH